MTLRRILLCATSGIVICSMLPAWAASSPQREQQQQTSPAAVAPAGANSLRPQPMEPGITLKGPSMTPMVLRRMQQEGTKLVSLGETLPGIMGYIAESLDGGIQTFYVLPDGLTVIAGVAFRLRDQPTPQVENLTEHQIMDMQSRIERNKSEAESAHRRAVENAEAARRRADEAANSSQDRIVELDSESRKAMDAMRQLSSGASSSMLGASTQSLTGGTAQQAPAPAGSTHPAVVTVPVPVLPKVEPSVPMPPAGQVTPSSVMVTPPIPLPGPATQATARPSSPLDSIPVSLLDKDRFLSEMSDNKVMWFDLGPKDAPMVVVIMDPRCPFCHAAWQKLRPMVTARQVRVRVVLIRALAGSEEATISILSRDEPGRAFWLGEGSTAGQPVLAAPQAGSEKRKLGEDFMRLNMEFVQKFDEHIHKTPFMAYVGADNQMRSLEGIENMDIFLKGLPASPVAVH